MKLVLELALEAILVKSSVPAEPPPIESIVLTGGFFPWILSVKGGVEAIERRRSCPVDVELECDIVRGEKSIINMSEIRGLNIGWWQKILGP
uniref:Uncharacterized protein n=1 Tax=Helianthus annuus TaxID=4232 RepID=A0A251UQ42_HELAN